MAQGKTPRHKLTPEQQLRGVVNALKSDRTPKQFKASLERRKLALEKLISGKHK
jgi:hypothetical protein